VRPALPLPPPRAAVAEAAGLSGEHDLSGSQEERSFLALSARVQ
jgi:hypothetical protein